MITGRSNEAAPKASRLTSQTGLKLTPSTDLATTTPTPRPELSGRRILYASQKVPFTRTQLAPPAQFPGPTSGAKTTTSAFVYRGRSTSTRAPTEQNLAEYSAIGRASRL